MNEQENTRQEITEQTNIVDRTVPQQEQKAEVEEKAKVRGVVLPPKKYKLKLALLFLDVWGAIIYGYYYVIRNVILTDIRAGKFHWFSLRMLSVYIVVSLTLAAIFVALIFKRSKSVRTRIERDNELRQDPNIGVWLTTFDWSWLILFVPAMVVLVLCGVVGCIISNLTVHRILGGIAFGFFWLNAAVVVFKLTPTRVLLIVISIFSFCLLLLLMGPKVFLAFFRNFGHLGIKLDPLGYFLMAYLGFFFLRIIWVVGLFQYFALSPNRLDLQSGLAETDRGMERKDYRLNIDTEDVILRLFKVGRIIISFPAKDREPINYLVTGIDKKAKYAIEAASILAVGRDYRTA